MAGTMHGILAGYDGSPGSEQALTWAAREARGREAVLTVCQAWALGYPAAPTEVAAFESARRNGEQTLAQGVRRARAVMGSLEVRPLLAAGPAATVLCERSGDAEMVVVGSRGHGGLAGLLLGSVSWQVAAHARGPVVVLRGHWRPAAGYVPGPVVVGVDGTAASAAAAGFAADEAALRGTALLAVCALADSAGSLGGAGRRGRIRSGDRPLREGASRGGRPPADRRRHCPRRAAGGCPQRSDARRRLARPRRRPGNAARLRQPGSAPPRALPRQRSSPPMTAACCTGGAS